MAIKIRRAAMSDIVSYLALQDERWDGENQASEAQLLSRFHVFPEGMMVAEEDGEIVGMVYAMRITDYDYARMPSWYEITRDGYCDNHDPAGKVIFGVDLSTKKGVGARAGDALLVGVAQLAIRLGVKYCMLGGRMPGYVQMAGEMSAEEYLHAKNENGEYIDRQVQFYTSVPGLRALKVLPNYFHDPESLDYGVLLRWRNPFYDKPFAGVWAILFPVLFSIEERYVKMAKR